MALRKFTFINQTEGFVEEQAATDEMQLGKLSLSGVGGIALDGGAQRAFNFAAPTNGSDLANKDYVDGVASGLDVKQSVRAATTANIVATAAGTGVGKTLTTTGVTTAENIHDGVTLALNNRLLVKDQTTTSDRGIYVVTQLADNVLPLILTRATDADQNAEVTAGLFVFVTEGTANADTGWVVVSDDAITVDTSPIVFSQFSSATATTFDQGLIRTGASVKVDLDTAASAQGAGAAGGSSGLEFDVDTAAGKIRAAVHATGGLERTATGLAAKLADATITSSASGLTVAKAPRVDNPLTADEAIAVGDPVAFSTVTDDRVVKGRADNDSKARVVGVARTSAAGAGNTTDVVTSGVAASTIAAATVGTPYYLQATGGLGTSLPAAGNRIIQCGIAKNASDLWVRIVDYGRKAA